MTANRDTVVVNSESALSSDSLSLVELLTTELAAKYGDDGGAKSFNPEDMAVEGTAFLVARINDRAVGCGAIRRLRPGVAEIKRMFVVPERRGAGVARQILRELESVATSLGYSVVRLETGLKQPEAIGLYESAGYQRVPCYGQYVGNSMSVCFEKSLLSCL
ncbi:MAG TPA: GNAT family N-acetyltransferase [Pyrinomonadaceae bacterium]|nr:GNAT family N-acetyltransferase [Pyrinomonadaceae bacterium]